MSSKTEICNLSLGHLGVGKVISNIETEKSEEANVCNRFYNITVRSLLRGFNYPFANKRDALALVEETPNTEWAFSYRHPSGNLELLRILSGIRNDNRDTRVPYKISQDTQGLLIFTDEENAVAEYTFFETDPSRYPPDFTIAFSHRLAAFIAPTITDGDPFNLGPAQIQLFLATIKTAQANAIMEEQQEQTPESEFIRARN